MRVEKLIFEVEGYSERVSAHESEYKERPIALLEVVEQVEIKGKKVEVPATLSIPDEFKDELYELYNKIREWAIS